MQSEAWFNCKANVRGLSINTSDAFEKMSTWKHADAAQSVNDRSQATGTANLILARSSVYSASHVLSPREFTRHYAQTFALETGWRTRFACLPETDRLGRFPMYASLSPHRFIHTADRSFSKIGCANSFIRELDVEGKAHSFITSLSSCHGTIKALQAFFKQ